MCAQRARSRHSAVRTTESSCDHGKAEKGNRVKRIIPKISCMNTTHTHTFAGLLPIIWHEAILQYVNGFETIDEQMGFHIDPSK